MAWWSLPTRHGCTSATRRLRSASAGSDTIGEVCTRIVLQLFQLSSEFLANPAQRDALIAYSERFIVRLFAGAVVLAV
jgi:hypothetical protein